MTEWQNVKTSELVRIVAIEDRAASSMAMLMRSEAAAELDRRFQVQPAAPVSGWRPIESGPVDMPVLCWEPDLGVCVGWRFSCLDSVWRTDSRKVKPTMWMPLPEVPK